jgi:hypothetical protein
MLYQGIIGGMPDDSRFHQGESMNRFQLFLKEMLDALIVLALIASVAFLIFFLVRREGNLPASGTALPGTAVLTSQPTETRGPTRVLSASPTRTPVPTQSPTVAPTPTATSRPTTTPASRPAITATLVNNSTTQLPLDVEMKDGIERGDRIVQAIEAYNQAKGFYPPALADLVPDYLPDVPVTSSGQPFFYRVFERTTVMSPEIYWVAFRVASQDHVTCTYYRRIQFWDCNFASP